jgi:hypothetical protein
MGDPSLHPVHVAGSAGDAVVSPGSSKTARATKGKVRTDPASLARVDVAVGELPQRNAPFRRLLVVVARQVGAALIVRHLYSR